MERVTDCGAFILFYLFIYLLLFVQRSKKVSDILSFVMMESNVPLLLLPMKERKKET